MYSIHSVVSMRQAYNKLRSSNNEHSCLVFVHYIAHSATPLSEVIRACENKLEEVTMNYIMGPNETHGAFEWQVNDFVAIGLLAACNEESALQLANEYDCVPLYEHYKALV